MMNRTFLLSLSLAASVAGALQAAPPAHHPAAPGPTHPAGPKVGGPLVPGGPTFGYGAAADLHTVEHGWRFREGHTERYIYIKVHNNSRHIWRDVTVLTGVYDGRGAYLRTESSRFRTPLLPGKTVDETFGPVGPQDRAYTIVGYKAHL